VSEEREKEGGRERKDAAKCGRNGVHGISDPYRSERRDTLLTTGDLPHW